jgi:uncharacterized protein YdeI (YjbR/CyaY-like superfamily)
MNPKVNFFFDKAEKWKGDFEKLRMTVLEMINAALNESSA